ncbi:MAG: MerR family transcriptional regulator [Acidobacteriota bacterium]|nr:MerR family transcriptional regulator [Acidobacteriota bacterium]
MKDWLTKLKGEKYIGVAELVAQAKAILADSNSSQEKGTVSEYPDERTIRYYITENLIPISKEKQGTASVFSYEHLLALLAIKKLQAQNLPIKKIREILTGKTVRELERLLGVDADEPSGGKNEAQLYLETLLLRQGVETNEPQPPPPLFSRVSPPVSSDKKNEPKAAQSWKRFEIEEGLELHVEINFKPSSDLRKRRTLLRVIEQIIQSLGQE